MCMYNQAGKASKQARLMNLVLDMSEFGERKESPDEEECSMHFLDK